MTFIKSALCCLPLALLAAGCAHSRPAQCNSCVAIPGALQSAHPEDLCEHRVPKDICARCHPEFAAKFRAAGDWCAEHQVPESQCRACHPDLSFAPPPSLPPGADFSRLSQGGEDVPSLEEHAVAGKVTVFDFYADWCGPCRAVDAHVVQLINSRSDIAYRRLNIGGWETPLAKRHLAAVPTLPYVVVYGRDRKPVRAIAGLDLGALDHAVDEGAAR
jgi:thiol-disulfide isomerase/thioredoxin